MIDDYDPTIRELNRISHDLSRLRAKCAELYVLSTEIEAVCRCHADPHGDCSARKLARLRAALGAEVGQ